MMWRFQIRRCHRQPEREPQLRLQLRRLLSERFDIALHPETRKMAAYDPEVGRGGARLLKATAQTPR
jgi:uncharacterized protein (TIGR03435 family)